MSKTITIKLTKASNKTGPFTITDEYGNVIATDVSIRTLIQGISYSVEDIATMVTLTSTGDCKVSKTVSIATLSPIQIVNTPFVQTRSACLWRHLTNIETHNYFYGKTEPYIIEYPFAYDFQDQILQNVKDYTKAYIYLPNGNGVFSNAEKIEVDDKWFNKAIVYNGQQSSGILELVPKPLHNMKAYLEYPKYNTNSKTILYTKSDNFYQYNTFWNVVKDKSAQLFLTSCKSLSYDKEVNQFNMDYSQRSFRKDTIRAKELKVRHILDNRSDVHLVSQFILAPSQISYK